MIERLSYDKRIIHYEMEHLMIRMTNKYLKEIPFLFRQRMEIQYGLMKRKIDQIEKKMIILLCRLIVSTHIHESSPTENDDRLGRSHE